MYFKFGWLSTPCSHVTWRHGAAVRNERDKTWRWEDLKRLMETTCVCRTQRRKETRSINPSINRSTIDGSTLREYKSPRKRFCRQHLATLATPTILRPASSEFSAGFVSNRRFTVFFDRYFHIPLPIVTKHELGLPFPPRNIPIKFVANPSTSVLVIVVTDRHTDTQTNAGENNPSLSRDNQSINQSRKTAANRARKRTTPIDCG